MSSTDLVPLFSSGQLADYLDARRQSAAQQVGQLSPEQLHGSSAATLAGSVVDQWSVVPLVLQLDGMQTRQDSARFMKEIATSDYGMPAMRNTLVWGCQMTYTIPFTGDPALWQLSPCADPAPPGAIDPEVHTLTLTLQNTYNVQPIWYRRELEQALAQIDIVIRAQTRALGHYHTALAAEVLGAVKRRQSAS